MAEWLSGHLLGNGCLFGLQYASKYKYLIVNLVFSHLGFWSQTFFLIAQFSDRSLLLPFSTSIEIRLNVLCNSSSDFLEIL